MELCRSIDWMNQHVSTEIAYCLLFARVKEDEAKWINKHIVR